MFYLAGISISFFLALILFSKKNKNLADKILAIWLMVIGVHLFFFYAAITNIIFEETWAWLLGIHFPIPLLHGPFLFLYAKAQTGYLNKFKAKSALHFLPAILSYTYLIPFFLLSGAEKIIVFKNGGADHKPYMLINLIALILSGLIYIFLTSMLLRKHRRNILQQFSSTEKINLAWIQYLIFGISIIWLLIIFGSDPMVFSTAVIFVLFIGYFGIRQVGIFSFSPNSNSVIEPEIIETYEAESIEENNSHKATSDLEQLIEPEIPSETETSVIKKKKYSKSGLSQEAATKLHDDLMKLMSSEKIYTQSDLTLVQLAKKLSTHPNYLSQVINHFESKNFYDYINTLRVDDLKERLSSSQNKKYTLLSHAFDSGFNSKSTFNKYFSKVTGMTPTEYLEKNLQEKDQINNTN